MPLRQSEHDAESGNRFSEKIMLQQTSFWSSALAPPGVFQSLRLRLDAFSRRLRATEAREKNRDVCKGRRAEHEEQNVACVEVHMFGLR